MEEMMILSILPLSSRIPFTLLFIHLILPTLVSSASSDVAGISYSSHCAAFVNDPPLLPNPNPPIPNPRFLTLKRAHIDFKSNDTNNYSPIPKSITFSPDQVYRTQNDAVYKIEGTLNSGLGFTRRRGLRLVHYRPPRIPVTTGNRWNSIIRFSLSGFWDSVSGNLCMIGSGLGKFTGNHVVLKLNYANSSNIFSSLVNGTLESLDVSNEFNDYGFFGESKLVSILGVNLRGYYRYELIDKEVRSNGFGLLANMASVSLGVEDFNGMVCPYIRAVGTVELEYMSDCNSVNCDFVGVGNGNYTPKIMYFNEIECLEDGSVRFLLGFGDFGHNGRLMPFEPNVTLVSEGKWDRDTRRLNMVGCRISSDGVVGECLVRLSLRFPARWTLRERSSMVGELWSSRSVNESGYFGGVSFASIQNKYARSQVLRYDYTEIENAKRYCENVKIGKTTGEYPNALSSDMRFDMAVENRKEDISGYSSPLYVDNRLYQSSMFGNEFDSTLQGKQNLSKTINVSYLLSLSHFQEFKLSSEYMHIYSFDISAEGIYNSTNGHVCMIGCMHVQSTRVRMGKNSSLDCEIQVDIRYPPLHSKSGGTVKGTIKSRREKSDRLYFEPLQIISRSIYENQAKESIWRMDLEITMVLISNTLSCIFIGLQLLHIKRHADILPLISITMLIVLTLAHMIPLLLNFEALFMDTRKNVSAYFGSDGWLEVNEVLVRVITMIAFLLEFRLLQLVWSSRTGDESQKDFWVFDKKVMYISLPIYVGGGLIAWLVHLSRKSYPSPSLRFRRHVFKQQSVWGDLKSYGGLILDGFLLPQILFNIVCDSSETALSSPFYIGMTFVRLLPHAYDLYRSHSSSWSFNYIYANPRMDYYSTTWDIVISIGGMLFVFLVFLQQRFSGRCFLPKRFRQNLSYEKVPVVASTEMI